MLCRYLLAVIGSAFFLTGCVPHIHDVLGVDADAGATLDAQQRVILVTHQGGKTGNRHVVCAEPSPDAMSAIATALAGRGGNGQVTGQLDFALSQTAAYIGLRTPTIQLLRDGLYRACEAYFNGVLDEDSYGVILRNYDRVMVSLLAIDATAGMPHQPPVTISGGNVTISQPAGSPAGGGLPITGSSGPGGSEAGGSSTSAADPAPGIVGASTPTTAAAAPGKGDTGASAPTAININTPGNTVAPVDNRTGIANGDQVIKTVTDYMLDNNKWLTAVCLTSMVQIAAKVPPGELAYDTPSARVFNTCQTVVQQVGAGAAFNRPRLYANENLSPPLPLRKPPAPPRQR